MTPLEERRRDREITEALSRIQRGPCGGWHYTDRRSRRHACPVCLSLGALPARLTA